MEEGTYKFSKDFMAERDSTIKVNVVFKEGFEVQPLETTIVLDSDKHVFDLVMEKVVNY